VFFIHIGRKKAGSSTIQQFLNCNAAALESAGVIYPETERERTRSHRGLVNSLKHAHRGIITATGNLGTREGLDALHRLAVENPDKRFILSSEGFESITEERLRVLAQALSPHKVQVVAYIRSFVDQMPSFYNQQTKSGKNTLDFDEFCRSEDYVTDGFSRIGLWIGIFGYENVRVIALETLSGEHALIRSVLEVVGLRLEEIPNVDPESLKPMNISLGWKSVELVRAAFLEEGRIRIERLRARQRSQDGLSRIKRRNKLKRACRGAAEQLGLAAEKTQYVSAEQARQLWAHYMASVDSLGRSLRQPICLPSPREIGERPFLPSAEQIPMDERTRFAELLAKDLAEGRFPTDATERIVAAVRH
jgi:hypothetical protein